MAAECDQKYFPICYGLFYVIMKGNTFIALKNHPTLKQCLSCLPRQDGCYHSQWERSWRARIGSFGCVIFCPGSRSRRNCHRRRNRHNSRNPGLVGGGLSSLTPYHLIWYHAIGHEALQHVTTVSYFFEIFQHIAVALNASKPDKCMLCAWIEIHYKDYWWVIKMVFRTRLFVKLKVNTLTQT